MLSYLEPIFGVPLEVAAERSCLPDKIPIPRIIRECIIFIEDVGELIYIDLQTLLTNKIKYFATVFLQHTLP